MWYGRRIDRLIQKTKFKEKHLSIVFVEFDEKTGLFKIDCRIHNNKKGVFGGQYRNTYSTEQEARKAIECVAAQYPGNRAQTVIIFDDLGDDDEED